MEIARAETWLSDAITTPAPMAVRKAQEAVGPRARETNQLSLASQLGPSCWVESWRHDQGVACSSESSRFPKAGK